MIFILYLMIILFISVKAFFKDVDLVSLVIITLPLFFKLKPGDDIYIHPTVIFICCMMAGYFFKAAFRPSKLKELVECIRHNILGKAITLFLILFLLWFGYGTMVIQKFDLDLLLRYFLYVIGFSIYPLAILRGLSFDENEFQRYVKGLFIVSLCTCAYALYFLASRFLTGDILNYDIYDLSNVALGTFGQYIDSSGVHIIQGKGAKTQFGFYLTIINLIILSLLLVKTKLYRRYILYSIFLINFIGIIFTASRMVWLLLVLTSLVVIYYRTSIIRMCYTLSVFFIGLILITWIVPENYMIDKIAHSFQIANDGLVLKGSAGERYRFWVECLRLTFSNVLYPYLGLGIVDIKGLYKIVPESLFLWFWMQMGVMGILILALIWHQILGITKKLVNYFKDDNNISSHISLVLYSFSIGWLLDALFAGGDFLDITLMVPFWGTLGLLIGYYKKKMMLSHGTKKRKNLIYRYGL